MAPPDAAPLIERVGGREVVERFVDDFYDRIEQDEVLRPLFPADLSAGRAKQKLFFVQWLGGEPGYSERYGHPRLRLMESVGYLEYLSLVRDAGAVLTDSGSVQAEAIALGVPCVALRDRSERQAAVQHGHARLVGHDPYLAVTYLKEMLADWPGTYLPPPECCDGRAASRIVNVLQEELEPAAAAVNGPGLQDVRA